MYGKLGHGGISCFDVPHLVKDLEGKRVKRVACGSRHTVALADGNVYTWGDKENGVSGHGEDHTEGQQYLPKIIDDLVEIEVVQISACGFHSAVLTKDGQVYTFGEGKFGRLGNNNETNQLKPMLVQSLVGTEIIQVCCGGFHTAAISKDGQLYSWGGGEHGQLGHGDMVNKLKPCLVQGFVDEFVVQVTCGWSHSVGRTDTGECYTFGNGDHGKLGHNIDAKVTSPRLIEALQGKRIVSIVSYNEHTIAFTDPSITIRARAMVSTSYPEDMANMVNNADYSDVQFILEGNQTIHAHRSILAVRCTYFAAMFRSGMRESFEKKVTIPITPYVVFMALMEFIYTDRILNLSPMLAVELFVAADLYQMDRLQGVCTYVVENEISVDNAANLLNAAVELNALSLYTICMTFIVQHMGPVARSEGYHTLSRELLITISDSFHRSPEV